jgi:hypothetical protein
MSDKPPLQSIWRGEGDRRPKGGGHFLHNHADGIASMDLFVVPTISFRLLCGLLLLHHDHVNNVLVRDAKALRDQSDRGAGRRRFRMQRVRVFP